MSDIMANMDIHTLTDDQQTILQLQDTIYFLEGKLSEKDKEIIRLNIDLRRTMDERQLCLQFENSALKRKAAEHDKTVLPLRKENNELRAENESLTSTIIEHMEREAKRGKCKDAASQTIELQPKTTSSSCQTISAQHNTTSTGCQTINKQPKVTSSGCQTINKQPKVTSSGCQTINKQPKVTSSGCQTINKQPKVTSSGCQTINKQPKVTSSGCQTINKQPKVTSTGCQTINKQPKVTSSGCQTINKQSKVTSSGCQTINKQPKVTSSGCQANAHWYVEDKNRLNVGGFGLPKDLKKRSPKTKDQKPNNNRAFGGPKKGNKAAFKPSQATKTKKGGFGLHIGMRKRM
ncbi:uncharacterized protein [Clytia hemisphaerica]|uniref:Uncharacterized protein n=1 Tax=Clytia hemisphaerica TaxID=252671 RepID=A0A7M5XFC6_9CNID